MGVFSRISISSHHVRRVCLFLTWYVGMIGRNAKNVVREPPNAARSGVGKGIDAWVWTFATEKLVSTPWRKVSCRGQIGFHFTIISRSLDNQFLRQAFIGAAR